MPTTVNFKNIIDKNTWRPTASPGNMMGSSVSSAVKLNSNQNPISDYRGNNYSNNSVYFYGASPLSSKGIIAYNNVLDGFVEYWNTSLTALGGGTVAGVTGVMAESQGPKGKITAATTNGATITLDGTHNGTLTGTWTRSTTVITFTAATAAVITASQSTNILTVSAVSSGVIELGMVLTSGSWAAAQSTIIGFLTGRGGTGTYLVSNSQTIGSSGVNVSAMHRLTAGERFFVMATSDYAAIALPTIASPNPIAISSITNNSQLVFTGINAGAASGTCTIGKPIRVNQWADRGDNQGFILRVIGNSSGGSGKIEERRIIANSCNEDKICRFAGTISTTTLTVSSINEGSIYIGMLISGAGVSASTFITAQLTGSAGSTGTYTVSVSQTVSTAQLILGQASLPGTTTPIVKLDKPLSFTPQAGDSWELLSGKLYLIGTGGAVANMFQSYDIANMIGDNTVVSQSPALAVTNLLNNASAYLQNPIVLDESHVPWNKIPGEGYVTGASTYDNESLTGVDYKNTKGCLVATAATFNVTAAVTTGSSTSGLVLTVGTLSSGTIAAGQILTGSTVLPNTIILYNISGGTGTGSRWAISQSQTVGSSSLDMYDCSITGQAAAGDVAVIENEYRNYQIRIVEDTTNPTAVGQRRRISYHSAGPSAKYMLTSSWTVTPSATCKFVIENWNDVMIFPGQNGSTFQTYKITNNCQEAIQLENTWNNIGATFASSVSTVAFAFGSLGVHFFGIDNSTRVDKHIKSSTCIFYGTQSNYFVFDISGGFFGSWQNAPKYTWAGGTLANAVHPSIAYNPWTDQGETYYVYAISTAAGFAHSFLKMSATGAILPVVPLNAPYGYLAAAGWTLSNVLGAQRLGMGVYVDPTDPTIKIPALYFVRHSTLQSEMYELLLVQ